MCWNVKHFFEDFLEFLEEPIDLRHFSSVFSEAFVSDIRLTVMYFSTALYKKQAFSSYFFEKPGFLHFAQFFPFNLEIMTPNLPKGGAGAGIISCVPAGRSAPA